MRLELLYRLTFRYPESWRADGDMFLIAEGRADGRVTGRFRGANHARRRNDRSYVPDLSGAIETEDGAAILFRLTGYGLPEAEPRGKVVAAATHTTDDARYAWLNDALCAIEGEVRGGRDIVLDVHELLWEPLAD